MGNTPANQIWQQCQKERKYTKDYKHVINIYTTTETENLADIIQTDRKVWELGQKHMDYFAYYLCEDI